MSAPAERFTDRAGAYARGRPGYPPVILSALLADVAAPPVVADLGAGTGISARALARAGARVLAIEPNAAMREAAEKTGASLATVDADITWLSGTAEATGLPDASVDVAVAFQAWHWFDAGAARREARRIVRPGGFMAVVYNERDERDPATAAYGAIVRAFALDDTEARRARALADFRSLPGAELTVAGSELDVNAATFGALVGSTSYLPNDGEAGTALRAATNAYFEAYATAGNLTLRLTTSLARARP